jgi:two-component system, LytTR family, response regulator
MLHAILIDDEVRAIKGLEILLAKHIEGVRVVATATDPSEGIRLINSYRPDVVFLDINMPQLNGFDLLARLEYTAFELVFCTAHEEFGLKALRSNAVDYLLKPVNVDELRLTIRRISEKRIRQVYPAELFDALKKSLEKKTGRVPLQGKTDIGYISHNEIVYIEASSHHSMVVLSDGKSHKVNNALKDYEAMLCGDTSPFLRIQASYIVNMNHVTRYLKEDGGYVVMQGNRRIPVSKTKREELFRRLRLHV